MSILKGVRCSWASIKEPNTKFDPTWEIVATLDEKQAAEFAELGFKVKHEEGVITYRFKQKCLGKKKDGTTYDRKQPFCVDASNQPFEQLIGNGSLVNIQYSVKHTEFMGNAYVKGELEGVQVVELVEFSASGGENQFEAVGETSIIAESKTPATETNDDINPY